MTRRLIGLAGFTCGADCEAVFCDRILQWYFSWVAVAARLWYSARIRCECWCRTTIDVTAMVTVDASWMESQATNRENRSMARKGRQTFKRCWDLHMVRDRKKLKSEVMCYWCSQPRHIASYCKPEKAGRKVTLNSSFPINWLEVHLSSLPVTRLFIRGKTFVCNACTACLTLFPG